MLSCRLAASSTGAKKGTLRQRSKQESRKAQERTEFGIREGREEEEGNGGGKNGAKMFRV